jgi:hypothetical protein
MAGPVGAGTQRRAGAGTLERQREARRPVGLNPDLPGKTSSTYTLADAVADYRAFGEHSGDCGDFVLLVDFTVERNVARWPDREVRHIQYIGHVHSSADTSRSIVRGGDFNLTVWLDSSGAPHAITRTGVFEYVEIDGRRVVTHVGRDELDFATGPISAPRRPGTPSGRPCATRSAEPGPEAERNVEDGAGAMSVPQH